MYESSAFPTAPVSLNARCPGGSCTDDGYDLLVDATIDVAGETDFYVVDVVDLPGHNFFLTAHLTNIPDDTNYDLYLYRFEGGVPMPLDDSTNNGTGNEVVSFSGSGDDESGQYGIEVRGVSGASCAQYRLRSRTRTERGLPVDRALLHDPDFGARFGASRAQNFRPRLTSRVQGGYSREPPICYRGRPSHDTLRARHAPCYSPSWLSSGQCRRRTPSAAPAAPTRSPIRPTSSAPRAPVRRPRARHDSIEVTGAAASSTSAEEPQLRDTFDMNGQQFIRFVNAGNVTITATGKLRANGDFVQQGGFITTGGLISITSSGVISMGGRIEVSGDSAGFITLTANGNVTLENNSHVIGFGVSSFPDLGMLFTDGGELDIVSNAGSITLNGEVSLGGANQGTGGIVDLSAAFDITVNDPVDLGGGGGGGGEFTAAAGDKITIKGNLICDSTVGGGSGGSIDLNSGATSSGRRVGGDTVITSASLLCAAAPGRTCSPATRNARHLALGNITIGGLGMVIRADAATNFDGRAVTSRSIPATRLLHSRTRRRRRQHRRHRLDEEQRRGRHRRHHGHLLRPRHHPERGRHRERIRWRWRGRRRRRRTSP
jgi:hypothetical protein